MAIPIAAQHRYRHGLGPFFQKTAAIGKKICKRWLTSGDLSCIIKFARFTGQIDGGIAQLARAFGSYPKCRRFNSYCRYHP